MEALAHNDIRHFAELAEPLLSTDPATHCVHLSTVDRALRAPADLTLVSLHDNGNLVGVATRSHPHPLHVAGMPPAAAQTLVTLLREIDPDLPAVVGPCEQVEAFRAVWPVEGGEDVPTWFYRLDALRPPDVPGTARIVAAAEVETWWYAFVRDTTDLTGADAEALARTAMERPATHLVWEVDGEPVAWATTTTPAGGVSRVGPVYAPPEHRGHGYAAAAAAAVTRWAVEQGVREVVLLTDARDPAPNKLYPRIGYRRAGNWSYWTFRR